MDARRIGLSLAACAAAVAAVLPAAGAIGARSVPLRATPFGQQPAGAVDGVSDASVGRGWTSVQRAAR